MLAKETEMAYLAKQTAEYKKMCDDMRSKLLSEATEVKVFNRLITPEMNRMNRLDKNMRTAKNCRDLLFLQAGTASSSVTELKSPQRESRCLRQCQRVHQV